MTFEEQKKIQMDMLRTYLSYRDGIPEAIVNLRGLANVIKRKNTRDAVLKIYEKCKVNCHRSNGNFVPERLYSKVAENFQNDSSYGRGVLVSDKPIRKAITDLLNDGKIPKNILINF